MFTSMYVLVAGIPLGFLLRKSKRAVVWTDKLLTLSVWILLFLLGIGLAGILHYVFCGAWFTHFCVYRGEVLVSGSA